MSAQERAKEVPRSRVKDVCYFCLVGHTFGDTDDVLEPLELDECYAKAPSATGREFLNGHSAGKRNLIKCPNYDSPSPAMTAAVKKLRLSNMLRASRWLKNAAK
jgi:hypothetical protein